MVNVIVSYQFHKKKIDLRKKIQIFTHIRFDYLNKHPQPQNHSYYGTEYKEENGVQVSR